MRRIACFLLIYFLSFFLFITACQEISVIIPGTSLPSPTSSPSLPVWPSPINLTATPTLEASPSPPPASSTPTLIPTNTPTPTFTIPPPIRFAVIGDYGSGTEAEAQVAELVHGWDPDFVITTGDNNYPSGGADTIDEHIGRFYHDFIYPYKGQMGPGADINRFFPSMGNHDWMTNQGAPYLDYFTLPGNERYYDFAWGPVHFFALNSNDGEPDGVGRSSVQAAWLKESLASASEPWKVVYMHHPPYSSGYHGSTLWMQWPFDEWGVDVVLSGHDHTYERLEVRGVIYFVNGLGGGARYLFQQPLLSSLVRYRDAHGAMLVTADLTKMEFQFINIQGEMIDHFILWADRP